MSDKATTQTKLQQSAATCQKVYSIQKYNILQAFGNNTGQPQFEPGIIYTM
jgi:hypothetical protein